MSASTQRSAFAGRPRRITIWWIVLPVAAAIAAIVVGFPLPPVLLGTVALVWALDNRRTAAPMSAVKRDRAS